MNKHLEVAKTVIHQDAIGLYSLNDLHKAAGGESRHKPSEWLRNKQTIELIEEVEIAGIPAIQSKQQLGTFAVKPLVYAYAMWISPKFHLAVISAYDALVTGNERPEPKKSLSVQQHLHIVKEMTGLVKEAAITKDIFIRSQNLNLIESLSTQLGITMPDPALLGASISTDHADVDRFWAAFANVNDTDNNQPFNHSARPDDEIAINLKQLLKHFESQHIIFTDASTLSYRLINNHRNPFIARKPIRSRLLNRCIRCMIFERH